MIMYDKRTLLDIGQRYTNLIQDTLSTDPAWPLEILLLANVQSFENKMDDLRARICFQRDVRDCNILCLTETWLTPTVPDTAVTPSDNFSVLRMDRTAEARKTKGGGVCFMINKKGCDPRNISILSCSCSPYLEHLSIICRPFYLPREFSSSVVTSVYIPPQVDSSLALPNLHDVLSGYINKHPDAAFIIAGDFNKANLKKVMPNFYQHISCPTRGLNTLDHSRQSSDHVFTLSDVVLHRREHTHREFNPATDMNYSSSPPSLQKGEGQLIPSLTFVQRYERLRTKENRIPDIYSNYDYYNYLHK